MAFDRERVLEQIQELLKETVLPGTQANLVSAGAVSRIIARDGKVSLIMSLPANMAGSRDAFKEELASKILDLDGVDDIQVLEKSAPQGQPAPAGGPATAPSGPGVGHQGIPGVRHVVAVASGKGGVGKSTVAVNLAVSLSQAGHKVGLLDADVYGPSIPKMLGLEGERPQVTQDENLIPLEAHGVKTMSIGFMLDDDSPVIWRGPMVTGLLRQFLNQVAWGELDYLILDLPPGTGDAQLTLVQTISLSAGLIVTTPQDVALLDVQRGIQMFQRVDVPIAGIIENMSLFECPKCGETTEIFSHGGGEQAAKRYDVPFLGSIPIVRDYALAGDSGIPVAVSTPKSAFAEVMRQTALDLVKKLPC